MVSNMHGEDHDQEMPFVDILKKMNAEGGFHQSVLATGEGLPIAVAPDDLEGDSTGALVAMLQRLSRDLQNQLDMNGINEITIRDQNRFCLVCRCIAYEEDTLVLAALVPPDHYYRRVTNRAVKRIRTQLA